MATARATAPILGPGERYESLVDALPDAVIIHTDGVIAFANRAGAELVGASSPGELLGRSVFEFVRPAEQEALRGRIEARLRVEGEGQTFEGRIVRLDGSEVEVEVRSAPVVYEGRPALQAIVRDLTEAKRGERALAEVERLARLGSWELLFHDLDDLPTASQTWSAEVYRILGLEPGEVPATGQSFFTRIHPEDRARFWATVRAGICDGQVYDVEHRIVRPDGEVRFVRGRARADRGATAGGLVRLVGTLQDVTESERSRRELETWKSRHDAVVRASGQILYGWDLRSNRLTWGGNFTAVLGHETLPDDLDGAVELIHPDDRATFAKELARVLETREPFRATYRLRHADGSHRELEDTGHFLLGPDGEPRERVGFLVDVTARRAAERAERESTERFRSLFDGLPLGLYRTTPEGRIDDVNPAFVRITGYPDAETLRQILVSTLYADPDQRAALRAALAEHGTVSGYELDLRRYDGTIIHASVGARAVRDARGEVVAYEGIVEDVSLRREMEQELLRARDAALAADRLKTIFLANMSHEIRTPLNAMLGYTTLVQDHLEAIGDRGLDECFAGIHRAGRRLLTTVHGILDLSRIEARGFDVRPKPLDVARVVRTAFAALEPTARAKGLDLRLRVDVEPVIPFDEYCLTQAVTHVIDNAVKFTERGGAEVRLLEHDGEIRVEVADTGVGIDPAYLGRLFEPFTQEENGYARRFEGSGLGLTLVRKYLELNGASVSAESRKGSGSTFRIRLAAAPPIAGPATPARPGGRP